jgi:hypothetical protein
MHCVMNLESAYYQYLQDLSQRLRRVGYRAKPVRRPYIAKALAGILDIRHGDL